MGTRSLTIVFDTWEDKRHVQHKDEICVMYRQMDGYLTGMGRDLVTFFQNKRIVNGISCQKHAAQDFNGMNCLAAAMIAHFKDGIGDIYLHPAGTRQLDEDYIYKVYTSDDETVDVEICEISGWVTEYKEEPGHLILENGKPTKWFIQQYNEE